jgi:hypothetical protein
MKRLLWLAMIVLGVILIALSLYNGYVQYYLHESLSLMMSGVQSVLIAIVAALVLINIAMRR